MTEKIIIQIKQFPHSSCLPLPSYVTIGSAGMDLFAAIDEYCIVMPMDRVLIPTGIAIQLPEELEGQIRPRSGLAFKHGVTVINSPGTIDSDYTGEIMVPIINLGVGHYVINHGDKIAQLVINYVAKVKWEKVTDLPETNRGNGGFGHTGY